MKKIQIVIMAIVFLMVTSSLRESTLAQNKPGDSATTLRALFQTKLVGKQFYLVGWNRKYKVVEIGQDYLCLQEVDDSKTSVIYLAISQIGSVSSVSADNPEWSISTTSSASSNLEIPNEMRRWLDKDKMSMEFELETRLPAGGKQVFKGTGKISPGK